MKHRKRINVALLAIMLVFSLLSGCNSADEEGGEVAPAPYRGDDYAEYIHDALESVSKDSEDDSLPSVPKDEGRVVQVSDGTGDNSQIYVSASEALPEESGVTPDFAGEGNDSSSSEPADVPGTDATDSDTADTDNTDSGTNSAEGSSSTEEPAELTPDTFDVGTCCIYIDGTIDTSYGSDIIKAINKARVDLGYPPLNEKQGLNTCADRRTREITCFLNHVRPNATPFYSLAPQYFKAEMLAIDGAKAEETVNAWIADPYSRQLVFTTKYTSIGAACFKCNTLNCSVVAFGY